MAKKSLNSTAARPEKPSDEDSLNLTNLPPPHVVVHLPKNASGLRNLNFAPYYGNGCDVVVYATQRTLERMAAACVESGGKTLSAATIAVYFQSGLAKFLPFCATMATALSRELRLEDIDRQCVDHLITHLRQSGEKPSSQKTRYTQTKAVLVAMAQAGWIANDIFPRNPFPNSNHSQKGQSPLSKSEHRSVILALKADMRVIVDGSIPLTSTDLAVCLLAIAARTGINPTPALELLTDCLQPHPIKTNRYVLVSFKRRGMATHIQSLRSSADIESIVSALPDVARIIELVRDRNATVRQASNDQYSLFVYESRNKNSAGQVIHMTNSMLSTGIKDFLARHNLTDADGRPLKLNVMRLRKTFENRLFSLSGQDPFLTAKLGGHTTKVSNDHYLEAPETAEKDWRLMGEVRNEALLNHGKVVPLPIHNTPVARCRDTLHGELAPKNGEHCQNFLACFRCRSFVVTADDLYRIFSLYWMLVRMRQSMGANAWRRTYGHIIRTIDQEIAPKFDAEYVMLQRRRARVVPHPFWRDPELLEAAG